MPSTRTRLVAAVAATALAAGGAGALAVALTHGGGAKIVTVAQQPQTLQISNVSSQLTVGEIADRSSKSVVEIVSTSTQSSPYPFGGGSRRSEAEGTGFVYDTSDHIVTNEHVIDGSSSVKVTFDDGSSYTATVVGKDVSTDLAVLKVNAPASKLVPLTLGDSSKVAVGDGVVAIGNPYGLTDTVTSGIVSALNREIQATNGMPIEGAIQTDAAINHGNSGGPLFDMQGDVIGITSQIESDSGTNDGIGFAIPSNTVRQIVSQLISSGTARHAFLGVSPQTAAGNTGVKVSSVEPGSAAAKGGLQKGDVITAVDGRAVGNSPTLRAAIDAHKPGDKIMLTVKRGGTTKTLAVTLGSRES